MFLATLVVVWAGIGLFVGTFLGDKRKNEDVKFVLAVLWFMGSMLLPAFLRDQMINFPLFLFRELP